MKSSSTWVWTNKASSVSNTTPLFCHCPYCDTNLTGMYSIQPRGINFSSQSFPLEKQVVPDQWTWGKKKFFFKKTKTKTLLLFFMAKEAEKCPTPCTCVQPSTPCKGASVSKLRKILSSLSSPACRCLPKVSSTPPITLAFTSLLCLICSSLARSSCERINWLQSCCSQGKIRCLRVFFFLNYCKDMEHRADTYLDLLPAICCDSQP